tara:strand:- start:1 stop:444 length:444 start_codon:yes stop_codon:yes gene_type:complete
MDALEDAVSDPETRNNQLIAALFNLRGRDIPEEEIEAMSPKALTLEIFNLLIPAQTKTEFWRPVENETPPGGEHSGLLEKSRRNGLYQPGRAALEAEREEAHEKAMEPASEEVIERFERTIKLTGKEQANYIRERFPDWKGPNGGAE